MTAPAVTLRPLPSGALLARYRDDGCYTDCYATDISHPVDLPAFITAFYNSAAFRPERWLLGWAVRRPAGPADVARLAGGAAEHFSAWSVEARSADQLLMCDFNGRTRSWLMIEPIADGTRLYFGSAVVPANARADRLVFTALLGFHRLYSRVLLGSAAKRL